MKISQFSVNCSRTVNLGNFESLRVEGSVVIALDDNDDVVHARKEAQFMLRQLLEDTYRHQHEDRKKVANK